MLSRRDRSPPAPSWESHRSGSCQVLLFVPRAWWLKDLRTFIARRIYLGRARMQIKISVPGDTFGAHDMRCYLRCRRKRKTEMEAFVLNLAASIHNAPLCCHLDGARLPHPSPFILLPRLYFPPYRFTRRCEDLYSALEKSRSTHLSVRRK